MVGYMKTAVAAAGLSLAAMPAQAAIVINQANSGFSFDVDYLGKVNGGTTSKVGALAKFVYTGTSNGGRNWNFKYSVTNDSDVLSQIHSFGLNVDSGQLNGISSTGYFGTAYQGVTMPEGVGRLDACFAATLLSNCVVGVGGLTANPDQTGTGTFALEFCDVMMAITLDDFVVRFQGIAPLINGGSLGVGIGSLVAGQVSAAPEPATWLTMLGGFGLVGAMLRRRKLRAPARQAA